MCFTIVPQAAELSIILAIDHLTMAIFLVIPQKAIEDSVSFNQLSDEAFQSTLHLDPSELVSYRILDVHLFILMELAIGLKCYANGSASAHCFAEAMLLVVFPLSCDAGSSVVALIACAQAISVVILENSDIQLSTRHHFSSIAMSQAVFPVSLVSVVHAIEDSVAMASAPFEFTFVEKIWPRDLA